MLDVQPLDLRGVVWQPILVVVERVVSPSVLLAVLQDGRRDAGRCRHAVRIAERRVHFGPRVRVAFVDFERLADDAVGWDLGLGHVCEGFMGMFYCCVKLSNWYSMAAVCTFVTPAERCHFSTLSGSCYFNV